MAVSIEHRQSMTVAFQNVRRLAPRQGILTLVDGPIFSAISTELVP